MDKIILKFSKIENIGDTSRLYLDPSSILAVMFNEIEKEVINKGNELEFSHYRVCSNQLCKFFIERTQYELPFLLQDIVSMEKMNNPPIPYWEFINKKLMLRMGRINSKDIDIQVLHFTSELTEENKRQIIEIVNIKLEAYYPYFYRNVSSVPVLLYPASESSVPKSLLGAVRLEKKKE